MDHLIKPYNPVGKRHRIKYACRTEYDGGDFCSYPARVGWSDEDVFGQDRWESHISSGRRTLEDMESFLQAWLFFGSLHAFFGNSVSFNDFITETTPGPSYIHTEHLLETARRFMEQKKQNGVSVGKLSNQRRVLNTAQLAYDAIYFTEDNGLDPKFVLSMYLLLNFLSSLHDSICSWSASTSRFKTYFVCSAPYCSIPDDIRGIRGLPGGLDLDYLQVSLIASGWCPHLVSRIGWAWRIEFASFMLLVGPPEPNAHRNCGFDGCLAHQVDPGKYIHSHVQVGCRCKHVAVDSNQLCSILESGQIPVVRINEPSKTRDLLILEAASERKAYVAISHVWSDGLGNPEENSIATCQFQRICNAISMLPTDVRPTAFWLDTICCPVRPAAMKKLAIKMMKKTYEEAAVVVAMDLRLAQVKIEPLSNVEIAARIMTSAWTQRLWTWQEGALAKSLYFEFRDQAFHFDKLKSNAPQSADSEVLTKYQYESTVCNFCGSLLKNSRNPEPGAMQLGFMVDALRGRSTSVATDEALCIASIANCNLSTILKETPENRMLGFWKAYSAIPTCVLFWSVPRLAQSGFRWAPKTLLGIKEGELTWETESCGRLSSRGLMVTCSGATLLSSLGHPISGEFWIRDEAGRWPFFVYRWMDESVSDETRPFEPPLEDDSSTQFSHVALLFENGLDEMDDHEGNDPKSVEVTLVYVYGNEDGVLLGRRGDRGRMVTPSHQVVVDARSPAMEMSEGTVENPQGKAPHNILVDDVYHAVEWRLLHDDQQWCID